MKIKIRFPGTAVTARLRAHVERQVGLALAKFGDGIGEVTVHFSDEGRKSHCRIDVALRIREVRVEHVDVDPARAVDHAAARLSDRVALAVEQATA
jgi:ribosome-associated translation inhibitor RaiA